MTNETDTKETDQASLGNLIQDKTVAYASAAEGMIELPVDIIQAFTLIPDYTGSPRAPNPIILKTPERCICLDGWSLIEQAKAQGISNICCFTYYSDECSNEEIAIRKAAVRIAPHAGPGSYVEVIRNVKMLHQMLLKKENVFELSHGGTRKGEGFISNKDDNVRFILAQRLGKSISTIGKYLNHAELLSDVGLNALMDAGEQSRLKPDKDFFEAAQSNKRRLKEILTSQGIKDAGLTGEVSRYVLGMYQEYRSTGKVVSINNKIEEEDDIEEAFNDDHLTQTTNTAPKKPTATGDIKEFSPPTFKYTSSADMAIEQEPISITKNDIHAELLPLASRLSSLAGNHDTDLNGITDGIKSIISDLSTVLQKALSIRAELHDETGR